MKLALECPTSLLGMVQPFADFDWILADRFLDDEEYAKYYLEESTNLKVVDNSVTEKGEPLQPEQLIEVANAVKPWIIVSPDWINDFQKTVEAFLQFKNTKFEGCDPIIAGVLQGSSPEEALQCLQYYDSGVVLVPYRVGGSKKEDPDWLKTLRRVLVVKHIPENIQVHLLGLTTLDEFRWYAGLPNVVSIDTDVPVRSGLAQKDFDDFDRTTDTSRIPLNKDTWAGICRNIAFLRKEINV